MLCDNEIYVVKKTFIWSSVGFERRRQEIIKILYEKEFFSFFK